MPNKKRVIIIGAGGQGKVILDILSDDKTVDIIGFLDDNKKTWNSEIYGVKVLGGISLLEKIQKERKISAAFVAIGDNRARAEIFKKCQSLGLEMIKAVYPTAFISKRAHLGCGICVMAQAAIITDAIIKDGVIINTGATIDHDNVLEEFCQISPGVHLAGTVTVKKYAFIGTGASAIPGVTIGKSSIIGAGAVVTKSIPDNVTAVGIPAKIIKENKI